MSLTEIHITLFCSPFSFSLLNSVSKSSNLPFQSGTLGVDQDITHFCPMDAEKAVTLLSRKAAGPVLVRTAAVNDITDVSEKHMA